jgi:hypothetical protein
MKGARSAGLSHLFRYAEQTRQIGPGRRDRSASRQSARRRHGGSVGGIRSIQGPDLGPRGRRTAPPCSSRCLCRRPYSAQRERTLAGGRPGLRGRRGSQPPERRRALGNSPPGPPAIWGRRTRRDFGRARDRPQNQRDEKAQWDRPAPLLHPRRPSLFTMGFQSRRPFAHSPTSVGSSPQPSFRPQSASRVPAAVDPWRDPDRSRPNRPRATTARHLSPPPPAATRGQREGRSLRGRLPVARTPADRRGRRL